MGGLTLARVLQVNGFAVTIYEAEFSAEARVQGGMLDIHEETGQAALKSAKLFDSFQKVIHAGGQASRVMNMQGDILVKLADDPSSGRPEVLRGDLRRLLLEWLTPGTIRWNSKLQSVHPSGPGIHTLTFANGETEKVDLLVGADGAWSKARPLLSNAITAYTGVSFIETWHNECNRRHPISAEVVGSGSLFALAPDRGILRTS